MSDPELANRNSGFSAEDVAATLRAVFAESTAQINTEIFQRDILQQRQGMYEDHLEDSGIAERATETLDVDMALHYLQRTKVFELEIDGVKHGGVVSELAKCNEPDGPDYLHYTTLYMQHGQEPPHYDTHDGLFTSQEITGVYGMAQELIALAQSGQIAPSPDLTSHHRPLPDEPIY